MTPKNYVYILAMRDNQGLHEGKAETFEEYTAKINGFEQVGDKLVASFEVPKPYSDAALKECSEFRRTFNQNLIGLEKKILKLEFEEAK